jgi:hypothetical protein
VAHKKGHRPEDPELVAGHESKHAMDIVKRPTGLREIRLQRQKARAITTTTPPTLPPIMTARLLLRYDSGDQVCGDGNVAVAVDDTVAGTVAGNGDGDSSVGLGVDAGVWVVSRATAKL